MVVSYYRNLDISGAVVSTNIKEASGSVITLIKKWFGAQKDCIIQIYKLMKVFVCNVKITAFN